MHRFTGRVPLAGASRLRSSGTQSHLTPDEVEEIQRFLHQSTPLDQCSSDLTHERTDVISHGDTGGGDNDDIPSECVFDDALTFDDRNDDVGDNSWYESRYGPKGQDHTNVSPKDYTRLSRNSFLKAMYPLLPNPRVRYEEVLAQANGWQCPSCRTRNTYSLCCAFCGASRPSHHREGHFPRDKAETRLMDLLDHAKECGIRDLQHVNLINSLARGRPDEAYRHLRSMYHYDSHTGSPAIYERVMRALSYDAVAAPLCMHLSVHMDKLGVEKRPSLYQHLFRACTTLRSFTLAQGVLQAYLDDGALPLPMSTALVDQMLSVCTRAGQIDRLFHLIENSPRFKTHSTATLNTKAKYMLRTGNRGMAHALLSQLKREELQPDTHTRKLLIYLHALEDDLHSAKHVYQELSNLPPLDKSSATLLMRLAIRKSDEPFVQAVLDQHAALHMKPINGYGLFEQAVQHRLYHAASAIWKSVYGKEESLGKDVTTIGGGGDHGETSKELPYTTRKGYYELCMENHDAPGAKWILQRTPEWQRADIMGTNDTQARVAKPSTKQKVATKRVQPPPSSSSSSSFDGRLGKRAAKRISHNASSSPRAKDTKARKKHTRHFKNTRMVGE